MSITVQSHHAGTRNSWVVTRCVPAARVCSTVDAALAEIDCKVVDVTGWY